MSVMAVNKFLYFYNNSEETRLKYKVCYTSVTGITFSIEYIYNIKGVPFKNIWQAYMSESGQ